MSNTHLVSFDNKVIQTTVTNKATEVDSWVNSILRMYSGRDMIVGLDCECRPTFVSGTSNTTATLQLCIDTNCLILQLFYMDYIPQSFKNFLGNQTITFVGVEGNAHKLQDEYDMRCAKMRDIRSLAHLYWANRWYRRPGLEENALRSQIVSLYMPKPINGCRSNWEATLLSNEQVEIATIDAYYSYRIGHRLIKEM